MFFIFTLLALFFSHFSLSDFQTSFKNQKVVASLKHKKLVEASGLEASINNPGYFWSHNDSGAGPILYLMDMGGEIKMEVTLEGVANRDWEEITISKEQGGSYIYIGEIGDNYARYPNLSIHKIKEPSIEGSEKVILPMEEIETMSFTYKEGARDAESMAFDYQKNELVIVTKRESKCLVYSFPFEVGTSEITSLGTIPQTNFTAMDISDEGEILLKNYDDIYYLPSNGSSVTERLLTWKPKRLNYEAEPQGEAICWAGEDFYTLSERVAGPQQLLYFERKK